MGKEWGGKYLGAGGGVGVCSVADVWCVCVGAGGRIFVAR